MDLEVCSSSDSFFVKAVNNMLIEGSKSAKVLNDGLKIIVGRGNKARYWDNIRWDLIPLKQAFPRIFVLAVNQSSVTQNFGEWNGAN
ncbi:hypothetical protein Dsin_025316 [Dipteronia sinensis]|uniref:Uncharacterized protein n=1 Tax=Dipteronia sinensis TaxID=43782 RepID=A0AAD9ZVS9_9ROSI|nr:hypothetical protein Dsin_025316 [Dipteronia sinensis]